MAFDWQILLPVLTTTISFLFFVSVIEQYRRKHRPHQIVWAVSMFLFFITAGAEAVSLIIGEWNETVYRTYYLFAAFQVSLMGSGLIYLFTSRSVINENNSAKAVFLFFGVWSMFTYLFSTRDPIFYAMFLPSILLFVMSITYLITNKINGENPFALFWRRMFRGHNFSHLFIIMAIYVFLLMNLYVWTSDVNSGLLTSGTEISGCGWETEINSLSECDTVAPDDRSTIRFFSPLHTVPGAIALIGGGVYSYVSWQRGIRKSKGSFAPMTGIYNIYIAFGAWVLGLGATLSGFGLGTLYISEVISVSFMYFGFLESDTISKSKIIDIFRISRLWKSTETI